MKRPHDTELEQKCDLDNTLKSNEFGQKTITLPMESSSSSSSGEDRLMQCQAEELENKLEKKCDVSDKPKLNEANHGVTLSLTLSTSSIGGTHAGKTWGEDEKIEKGKGKGKGKGKEEGDKKEEEAEKKEEVKPPKKVEISGFHFNEEGKLVDADSHPFKFTTQAEYEKLGEHVTQLIYSRMEQPPYCMLRVALNRLPHLVEQEDNSAGASASSSQSTTSAMGAHEPETEATSSAPIPPEQSFVFLTPNYRQASHLLVLIHGSGVVRAGQWARRLLINDSLDSGSQLPYIDKALNRGWAVLVMNTNDNRYTHSLNNWDQGKEEEKGSGKCDVEIRKKKNSSTPEYHGLWVWHKFVYPMLENGQYKKVAIVAHSYGGVVTDAILGSISDLIRADLMGEEGFRPIKCICLTDAVFTDRCARALLKSGIGVRNWVSSSLPLDSPMKEAFSGWDKWRVSAGTEQHEKTSSSAIHSVFNYIEGKFRSGAETENREGN